MRRDAVAKAEGHVPSDLAPGEGEAAVLSLLAAKEGADWVVTSGSLLAVREAVANMSWPSWAGQQPPTRGPLNVKAEADLGAAFTEEPFPGIRIARAIVKREDWQKRVKQIEAGSLEMPDGGYRLNAERWGAIGLLAQNGLSDAHKVIRGVRRPVRGASAAMQSPELAWSDGSWVRGGLPKPLVQHTREELQGKETFTGWPKALLGIDWLGDSKHPPPHAFVVGRAQGGIWIADVVPQHDDDQLKIVLGWEADKIDPLSCAVLVRGEQNGMPLFTRYWKISDLPGEIAVNERGEEARDLAWHERTIDVRLPRGARRTDWGMSLLGPDGWLLDELPVVSRVERLELSMHIGGDSGTPMKAIVGDRRPNPTQAERDQEIADARELEEQTRAAAARRRLATVDDLQHYLRWRFSARAGELLLIDRYLLDDSEETVRRVVNFLASLKRPIRALASKVDESAPGLLAAASGIEVRRMPKNTVHDRLWIVSDSGVSVGASVNGFVRETPNANSPATTAVDLPFADITEWRQKFEGWWSTATPL